MNPARFQDTPKAVRLTRCDRVYEGRLLKIDLERLVLPGGATCDLEIIRHPGASAVVPLTKEGSVVMIRQYRHAAGGYLFEIPAGKLDPGETPEACALRETQEEVGMRPQVLHALGPIHTTPGFTDEIIHLFVATDLTPVPQALESDEMIEVFTIPLAQALTAIREGEVTDGKTICALFRTEQELAAGRIRFD
jgi:ADP-ribose pyrophosphatase